MTDGPAMKLGVVILNWNRAEDTIRCATAVAGWRRLDPALWIVDNASEDGSGARLTRVCPGGATVVRSAENRGFGGGNNLGIAAALDTGCEAVLLLNNDATLDEADAARLCASLAAHPDLAVIGPVLVESAAGRTRTAAGGRDIGRYVRTRIPASPGRAPAETPPRRVPYVPGTAALVRAGALRAVGLLDEAYFFGGELADFCWRARARGYACAIDLRAEARHDLDRAGALRPTLHAYYVLRNRFLFLRKHRGRRAWPLLAFWTGYGILAWLHHRLAGRPAAARARLLALLDGLAGREGGQNARVLAR